MDEINNTLPAAPEAAPAEALPQVAAPQPQAPAVEEHTINVIDPDTMEVGSLPSSQLQDAISQGYTVATPEQVHNAKNEAEFGTAGQQAITALEGAGEGATFGLSTGLETGLGLSTPERIQARRETNPGVHGIGEAAGMLGSSLIGVGEGAALTKAGQGAAKALGLGAPASFLGKIGSSAAKLATESALASGGNEVGKMLSEDPNQTVETAVTNVGLAGVLGAGLGTGFGVVPPIWKAATGSKTAGILKAMADKAGGVSDQVPDAIHDAIQTLGMNISPEIKAGLSKYPEVQQMFQNLADSSSSKGAALQDSLRTFKSQAADAALTALDKSPESLGQLEHLSENEVGNRIKDTLKTSLKEIVDPISEKFEQIRTKFKGTELPEEIKSDIATKLGELSTTEGYNLSTDAAQSKFLNRVMSDLPNLKTLEDVRKYTSLVGSETSGIAKQDLWGVGRGVKTILRDAEENIITSKLGAEAPDLIATHQGAKAGYRDAMNLIDTLNDRLHVGKYSGPKSFIDALGEMDAKDVISRLSPKGRGELIQELQQYFPKVAQDVRDYHLDQILKKSMDKAADGESINVKTLFDQLGKLNPEMKEFLVSGQQKEKLEALKSIIDGLPSKIYKNQAARMTDAVWEHVPSSAVGMASAIHGHNPVMSLLMGALTGVVSKEAPDAVRMSVLKYLGSSAPMEAGAFKSMVDFIQSTIKGNNLVGSATKNVFKAGSAVLPQAALPKEPQRAKLEKQLNQLSTDPKGLLNVGGQIGHYLPEQGAGIAQLASNAVNFLNSIKPATKQQSPMDTPLKPTAAQQAIYNRALDIANQPLVVLDAVKRGTVTPNDIIALKSMYPTLYKTLSTKLMDQMTNTMAKGEQIPYTTKMGISLFLGQPMDSTMTPSGIQAAQPAPQPPPATQGQGKAISKLPASYATESQARDARSQAKR